MEFVDKEEEWLESSIKQNTKLHHAKAMSYLKEFMQETPENILKRRTEEGEKIHHRNHWILEMVEGKQETW